MFSRQNDFARPAAPFASPRPIRHGRATSIPAKRLVGQAGGDGSYLNWRTENFYWVSKKKVYLITLNVFFYEIITNIVEVKFFVLNIVTRSKYILFLRLDNTYNKFEDSV